MIAVRVVSILIVLTALGCIRREHAPPPVLPPPPGPDRAAIFEAEVARLRLWLVAREARIQEVSLGEAVLEKRLQDVSSLNDEMSGRLELSSRSVEQLAAERERLLTELAEAQERLEALKEKESSEEEPTEVAAEESAAAEVDAPAPIDLDPALVSGDSESDSEIAVVPEP